MALQIAGDDTPAIKSVLQADEERESLLKEEKQINQTLNKSATTPEESEKLNARLKEVYAKLEEIEADKAESKYGKKLRNSSYRFLS